jgi:hypothetical protein
MRFAVKIFFNAVCFCILLGLCGQELFAKGWRDQIETVTAEGGEVWENDFDVTRRKKGLYNFIAYARDRAGNESVSGPFNVRVDPYAGLPSARVVYPENNSIIRQSINVLGVASGRYGVDRVVVRLNGGEYMQVSGTEYWNQFIDLSSVPDGRHTLSVLAIDSKETSGYEVSISFILDTSPPAVSLTSHQIGDIVGGSITLAGVATDANGIRSLEYSADGVSFLPLPTKSRDDTRIDFSIPINTRRLPDGPMVYYFRAMDKTGIAAVRPLLFFVSNIGPELEVYTPAPTDDVFSTFYLSGRVFGQIGISNLYYEWGRVRESIEFRTGDPFWHATLVAGRDSANSVRVVAVDKVGNTTSVTHRLEDRRRVKVPVLIIDYPPEATLKNFQRGMPADTAIYGRIAPGVGPRSVLAEGIGEVEAITSFRISASMLPAARGAQNLKLTPSDVDGVRGAPVTVRYLKQEQTRKQEASVVVSLPERNAWRSGASFTLEGYVGYTPNMRLDYRIHPSHAWQPVQLDEAGRFSYEVGMAGWAQGPVHLELRTVRGGQEDYPFYHPFNWSAARPEIAFISPPGSNNMVYGSKTVMGSIAHNVPIRSVAYSFDGETFADIPFVFRYGKAWFNYFCDFNTLSISGGQLSFRITDASGAEFIERPQYTIDPNPPLPIIVVNAPVNNEVIRNSFEISGLAYDQVGIRAVYWRLLGPRMSSISPMPIGEEARRHAAAYEADPDRPFQEILTTQSFQIPIEFSRITDGEFTLEMYAADIYGVRSELASRTLRVSTAPPETVILSPPITIYNRKAIEIRGASSDANGIYSVSLSMDSGNTFQGVNLHDDDTWELPLNTAAYIDGVHSALVRTSDRYGVVSYSNVMLNIDNTSPELYLTSPLDGQHVGTAMSLMGRVSDNLSLSSLTLQIINAANPTLQRTQDIQPKLAMFENVDLSDFPPGEHMVRIVAKDLADNETIISRKVIYDPNDAAAQIAIYNPLPGEIHSGPIHIVGIVDGSFKPGEIYLTMNDRALAVVPVDRYGVFHYQVTQEMLGEGGAYRISSYYDTATGTRVQSPSHTVYYSAFGPILQIESHQDGDVITGRPWLSGRTWYDPPQLDASVGYTRGQVRQIHNGQKIRRVRISLDNGRTFSSARGDSEWEFRMETSELPRGPQPILVKAEFVNGEEAVRRIMLHVDTTLPQIETITPPEDSRHRENIAVFGTAGDNYELANVDVSLRPHNKFWYSVPGPIRGLYFDVKGLGATYFDVGLGLSFFDDNVRLQAQFGITPADGMDNAFVIGGRYVGYVYGVKLLANIFTLPFSYLFGLDWAFYSMNFALGANFSYFMMDEWRTPLYMGAVVGQWDIANINLQYFYPNWKYFRNFALYLSPELWFASSDINAETIFRMTVGLRINWF